MTDTAFQKLMTMWRSGEINDDEFRLATQYLREEQSKLGTYPGPSREPADCSSAKSQSLGTRVTKLLLPRAMLEKLPSWQRHLVELGLCVLIGLAVASGGVWASGQLTAAALDTNGGRGWNLNPLGAAGLTLVVLAVGGRLVGYNRRILGIVSVPLFLLLLFSPLWKAGDVSDPAPARRTITVFEQPVSVSDYGTGWPYPDYTSGMLRCQRTTISGVTRSLVTIELGGLKYGLNGAASGWGGYTDSRTLMKKHPQWDTYELGASDLMRSMALKACEAQG